jgi:hypothetical protein
LCKPDRKDEEDLYKYDDESHAYGIRNIMLTPKVIEEL